MHKLAQLDRDFIWHPFTQMREWNRTEPIVITAAKGTVLRDAHGKEYLDANSSIWTNIHGHNHPVLNRALQKQSAKIAHSSALGFANEPAALLAEKLIASTRLNVRPKGFKNPRLSKVFYSDDGSTALEVAVKLSYQSSLRTRPKVSPRFLAIDGAYHGDTVGAVSLGHIDLFHKAYSGLLFKSDKVMAPYCYRCPFNKAKPERADAREYRKCNWECVSQVERTLSKAKKSKRPYTAFSYEPLMQGAAGMIPQPQGWLHRVAGLARDHGAHLIADEVMTGFGRCNESQKLYASHQEGVQPDFLCLAKGLSGGYLPVAATLTTKPVFDSFLGDYHEFKSFFHGHSYFGNQLGTAVSHASLDLLARKRSEQQRANLQSNLKREIQRLWELPHIGDIRQVGNVVGVELVKNWKTRKPFDLREQAGIRVCNAMAKRGVLTRPIGSVIALMPPYCTTQKQVRQIVAALYEAVAESLPPE